MSPCHLFSLSFFPCLFIYVFFFVFIIFQPGLPAPPLALISDLVSTKRSEDLFALKEFINLSPAQN